MPTAQDRVDVACPECGKVISIRREKFEANIGKRAKCPDCRAALELTDRARKALPSSTTNVTYAAPPMPVGFKMRPPKGPTPLAPKPSTAPSVETLFDCVDCGGRFAVNAVYSRGGGSYICFRCHQPPIAPQPAPVPPLQPTQAPVVIHNNIINTVAYEPAARWNPAVAALLSFFIPGLGQMYKGQVVNGLAWLILTIIGYACLVIPGLVLHLLCVIGALSGNPRK